MGFIMLEDTDKKGKCKHCGKSTKQLTTIGYICIQCQKKHYPRVQFKEVSTEVCSKCGAPKEYWARSD